LTFLNRWDGPLFLKIARYGYALDVPGLPAHDAPGLRAFFPLYPLLVRATAWIPGLSYAAAGVIVSVTAGAVTVVIVQRIGLWVTGAAGAHRGIILLSFFPGAMVLSMPASEGIMMALAAAAVLALLQNRWLLAGMAAAGATASRASALGLVLTCLWAAVQAHRRGDGWRPFVAPGLAPVGALAYFGFLWARTGDPWAYLHAEKAWGSRLGFGEPARILIVQFFRAPFTSPLAATATLSLIAAIVATVVLLRRGWPSVLSVYTLSVLVISVMCRIDGLRPRDVLTAFPLFLAVGHVLRGPWFGRLVALLGTVMAFSLLFHNLGSWGQP
jgi:hypothetical protein